MVSKQANHNSDFIKIADIFAKAEVIKEYNKSILINYNGNQFFFPKKTLRTKKAIHKDFLAKLMRENKFTPRSKLNASRAMNKKLIVIVLILLALLIGYFYYNL